MEKDSFHYKTLRLITHWSSGAKSIGSFYVTVEGDEYLDAALPMVVTNGDAGNPLDPDGTFNFRSFAGGVG